MNTLDNLSMKAKLFLLSGLTGLILAAALAFALLNLKQIDDQITRLDEVNVPSITQVAEISQLRLRYRVRSLEYLLAASREQRDRIGQSLEQLDGLLIQAIEAYRPLIKSDRNAQLHQAVVTAGRAYAEVVEQARVESRAGNADAVNRLVETVWVERANAMRDATDALIAYDRTQILDETAHTAANVAEAFFYGIIVAVIGILVAIILTVVIASRIGGRLADTVAAVKAIADGNLNAQLPARSRDELGTLIAAVGDMQTALHKTISQTRHSADQVATSARDLKESAGQVNESACVQSGAASAIAANVEELTVSITHVSDRSSDAARFAADSDKEAREGQVTVDKLVRGIGEMSVVVSEAARQISSLEAQSEQISRIVSVIREIAEQTNLLALNAAIEAARAGESGRGFAVVADEVRKLSERTAQSTEEIARMVASVQSSTAEAVAGIEKGVGAVDENRILTEHTGETFARLQDHARKVSEIVSELDIALREQASASSEVARRVEEIAVHSEQTSSATAQSVASANALDSVAAELLEGVRRFRL